MQLFRLNKHENSDEKVEMLKNLLKYILDIFGFYPKRALLSKRYGIMDEITSNIKIQKAWRDWPKKDYPRLKELKDIHKYRDRCFIIGNGPSLKKIDLHLFKNEITLAVNAIFLLFEKTGFKPTYYVVTDHLVCEDRVQVINKLDGMVKFTLIDRANFILRNCNTIYLKQKIPTQYPQFSKDVSECIYGGYTVTYVNLQLAFHMGFRKVYLVGMDHNYLQSPDDKYFQRSGRTEIISTRMDPNHFHPDYFGHGKGWHVPNLIKMEMAYKKSKEVFENNGRKIFNATAGGKLEAFERVKFDNLFL